MEYSLKCSERFYCVNDWDIVEREIISQAGIRRMGIITGGKTPGGINQESPGWETPAGK